MLRHYRAQEGAFKREISCWYMLHGITYDTKYAEWVMPDPPMQECARNKLKG